MVANISIAAFVWLFFLTMTVFMARVAWLYWFHPDRAPRINLTKSSDPSVIRGHVRGILPFVGFPLGLTVLFPAILASTLVTGTSHTVFTLIAGACIPGFMLSLAAHATVAWFNWPKFLAPPHLRDETGDRVVEASQRASNRPRRGSRTRCPRTSPERSPVTG
ncbi:putative membrane protein [Streptacidiphilus sp. MAP12-16]|uniref:hypothetical protein n=1 Tax=Streptacidiphilus sp. MAP12-16 TaxID=3156300 RepID=UPI0035160AEA